VAGHRIASGSRRLRWEAARQRGEIPEKDNARRAQAPRIQLGGQRQSAAELLRFGPKAFKTYYNIRDPPTIQQRAESEIPLESIWRTATLRLLAVRGPAPAAKAVIPNNTPAMATKLVINATRHPILKP
jgi:hypothetical protein